MASLLSIWMPGLHLWCWSIGQLELPKCLLYLFFLYPHFFHWVCTYIQFAHHYTPNDLILQTHILTYSPLTCRWLIPFKAEIKFSVTALYNFLSWKQPTALYLTSKGLTHAVLIHTSVLFIEMRIKPSISTPGQQISSQISVKSRAPSLISREIFMQENQFCAGLFFFHLICWQSHPVWPFYWLLVSTWVGFFGEASLEIS